MTDKTGYFWTDIEQAQTRLIGCVVLYDGQPVYIDNVTNVADDDIPRAHIRVLPCKEQDGSNSRKMLNSPKFNKFRKMPNLGWMNVSSGAGAVFLARQTHRATKHGLTVGNVLITSTPRRAAGDTNDMTALVSGAYNFSSVMFDKGFVDAHNGQFPSLESVLARIEEGSSIAFSRKYCVIRDYDGIRWLFRDTTRVGIFTGVDTLNLLSRHAYLREEVMDEPAFTVNTITEF